MDETAVTPAAAAGGSSIAEAKHHVAWTFDVIAGIRSYKRSRLALSQPKRKTE